MCRLFYLTRATVRAYVRSLTLARPRTPYADTHLTHRPIPERGYATRTTMETADAGETYRQNLNPLLFQ